MSKLQKLGFGGPSLRAWCPVGLGEIVHVELADEALKLSTDMD